MLNLSRKTIVTSEDWVKYIVAGDFHIGQQSCDEMGIKRFIDWIISKDPKTHRLLLTGDIIENVILGSKGSPFEMVHANPEKQIDVALELLTPAKSYIDVYCDGNHEYRTEKTTGISVSKTISMRLGVPYAGYRTMLEVTMGAKKNPQTYLIYVEHGAGSIPKSAGSRYNKLVSVGRDIVADVYVKGHIHHKLAYPKSVWKEVGGVMVKRKTMYVSNGSYLDDAEYAVRSGYDPTEPGVAKIELSTKRFNIHCSV